MNLLDDEIVAALGRFPKGAIDQRDGEAREGQAVKQVRMVEPGLRGLVQCPEEEGAKGTDARGHRHDDGGPFEQS